VFDGLDPGVQALFIAPADLLPWATRIRPHLDRMAQGSGGRYDGIDILAALAAGRMLLWIALDGSEIACVLLTELLVFPRLREMRCIGVVGHRPRRWMGLLAYVEREARDKFGCARFSALHQPGHDRLLRTGGWRAWHVLSEKDI
jgi:hypothetical protein